MTKRRIVINGEGVFHIQYYSFQEVKWVSIRIDYLSIEEAKKALQEMKRKETISVVWEES